MPKNKKSDIPNTPYFVTFTIVKWINIFTKPFYMKIIWDSLQYCRKEKSMGLYGFVFMTNHLHLIISAKEEKPTISDIVRDFRKYTAQKIIQQLQNKDNRKWILDLLREEGTKSSNNVQYKFWTHSDWAEEIYSAKFFEQKLNYLHMNPVKALIVKNPTDYVWSSARCYENGDHEYIDRIIGLD